jgi:hypothetical protein
MYYILRVLYIKHINNIIASGLLSLHVNKHELNWIEYVILYINH